MNQKILAIWRLSCAAAPFCISPLFAADLTVGSGGGFDHSTIQAAINAAASGDTIIIGSGTFSSPIVSGAHGFLTINKPLTIRGAGREQTFITSAGTVSGSEVRSVLITPAATGTVIEDLTFAGWDTHSGSGWPGGGYLVWQDAVSNITYDNVGFDGNNIRVALFMRNSNDLTITNSSFSGHFFRQAIRGSGARLTIEDNEFETGNYLYGAIGMEYGHPTGGLIKGNSFRQSAGVTQPASGFPSLFKEDGSDLQTIFNYNPVSAEGLAIEDNSFEFLNPGQQNFYGAYPVPTAIYLSPGVAAAHPVTIQGNSFEGYDYRGAFPATDVPVADAAGQYGGALRFNGTNAYAEFTDATNNLGPKGTFSFWVKLDPDVIARRNQILEGPGDGGMEFQFRPNSSGQFYGTPRPASGYQIQSGGAAGTATSWTNLQYTWDAGTGQMKIYMNGVEVAYSTTLGAGWNPGTAINTTVAAMVLGRDPGDASRFLKGALDDVALFNDVLDPAALASVRLQSAPISTATHPSLKSYWSFDSIAGTAIPGEGGTSTVLHLKAATLFNGGIQPYLIAAPTGTTISENQFLDHPGSAVVYTEGTVNAAYNFWGDAAGPLGGDLLGNVITAPYYTDAALTSLDAPVKNVTNPMSIGYFGAIQPAIDAAAPGDTIELSPGSFPLTAAISVNKANLTIQGPPTLDAVITGAFGIGDFIQVSANGVTLKQLNIQKTDKTGPQALVYVGADNLTVEDCEFSGQYVLGDPDVSRGFLGAYGTSDLNIVGNSFQGLRQPGYLNGSLAAPTTGTISNNSVTGTRGWVIDGALMVFTGNTWSGNAVDIAILSSTEFGPPYDPLSSLISNNNGASISDQRVGPNPFSVKNLTTSVTYGTIQAAIDAATDEDTLTVEPGTYSEAVALDKDLTIQGSGSTLTVVTSGGTVFAITSGGSGSTISGLGVTGGSRGFNLHNVSNVSLDEVSSTGNSSYGLNVDGTTNQGITLTNSSFSDNGSVGVRFGSTARADNLLIEGCAIDGNDLVGLYIGDGNVAHYQGGAMVDGLTVTGTSFSNNLLKGIYLESANDILFEGLTVENSGTLVTNHAAGIDINLKFATYQNVTIRDSLIKDCGNNNPNGGGILLKARNDGGTYGPNPAVLGGTVLLEGLRVENCGAGVYGAGIRIGESNNALAGVNVTPSNVVIRDSALVGNGPHAVRNALAAGTVLAEMNYWGNEDGPAGASVNGAHAADFNPWYATSDASVPPVLSDLRSGILVNTVISTVQPNVPDLYIAPGTTVTVTPSGGLSATELELADGATLIVNGGSLDLGQGSLISGTFTIFNSFGSWDINGDTTFEIGQSLALISDIHVTAGVTLTVNGGGELILDGCVIDSQTPGMPYSIDVEDDGLLTIARSVVSDALIDIDTLASSVPLYATSRIYDSRFSASDLEASAASAVYHNLFDAATDAASNSDATAAFGDVDGWGNVTDELNLRNRFSLEFEAPVAAGRTLDAGNLFVQTGDAVTLGLEMGNVSPNTVTLAEALLGYNSERLVLVSGSPAVTPAPGWDVLIDDDSISAPLGMVDSALSLELDPGDDGISGPATIGSVNFTAGTPGATVGFFRVQTDGNYNPDGSFQQDTRLTKSSGGVPSFLTAFTANSGELVVDNDDPAIDVSPMAVTGVQTQPTVGSINVLLPTSNHVIRDYAPVILTFSATDTGLAGLDAADATSDLVLTANNGLGSVLDSDDYAVTAVESLGTVTYTVELDVPATAANGTYAITATVRDRSGNVSLPASLGSFQVANEVLATVELQGFVGAGPGSLRDVVFFATGGVSTKSWTKSVSFTSSVGTVALDDVPAGTTGISAKTSWTVRSKKAVALSLTGTGVVSLTGTDRLNGGDFNGDNVVNTLDYSILRFHWLTSNAIADVTGNGNVNSLDYNILTSNFYTVGDPQ